MQHQDLLLNASGQREQVEQAIAALPEGRPDLVPQPPPTLRRETVIIIHNAALMVASDQEDAVRVQQLELSTEGKKGEGIPTIMACNPGHEQTWSCSGDPDLQA